MARQIDSRSAPSARQPSRSSVPSRKSNRRIFPFCLPRYLKLAAFDLFMICIGLVIFAYFHHVRPAAYSTDDLVVIPRTVALTDAPDSETTLEGWGLQFAGQFTEVGVESTDTSYRSENISISIEQRFLIDEGGDPQTWYVADIYIRDIDVLRTAFAEDTYGKGYKDWPSFIAYDNNAVLAISGDYYGAREKGVVIRNGTVYRSETFKDVCVLYYDGVMETMSADEFDLDSVIERGAYQAFSFGPALLDESGYAKEEFDSDITAANPRCAIGYFEPGHYCFVVVDGRQDGYSEGMTLQELAQVFEDMGCVSAYNLDGGKNASMVFMNKIVNSPYDGGRKVSDIIYIGEANE